MAHVAKQPVDVGGSGGASPAGLALAIHHQRIGSGDASITQNPGDIRDVLKAGGIVDIYEFPI